jgi:Restriction endonuclease
VRAPRCLRRTCAMLPAMTAKRSLPGRDFQDLVAAVEKALAPIEHKITSPMRLRDRDTGRLREHDVVVEFTSGRHPFKIAIEARDKGRKVGVPDVEGFGRKCERTGIDRGVIVSSRGFAETALTKANADNIGCLTLAEATAFDWCHARSVTVRQRDGVGTPHFVVDLGGIDPGPEPPVIAGLDDTPWSDEARTATAQAWLFGLPEDDGEVDGGVYTREVRLGDPPLVALCADGRRLPLKGIVGVLSYRMSLASVPLRFHSYRSEAGSEVKCDLASAEVGGTAGRVVLERRPDGSTKITLVAGPELLAPGPRQGTMFLGRID